MYFKFSNNLLTINKHFFNFIFLFISLPDLTLLPSNYFFECLISLFFWFFGWLPRLTIKCGFNYQMYT